MDQYRRARPWRQLDSEEKEIWAPWSVGINKGILGVLLACVLGSVVAEIAGELVGVVVSFFALASLPFFFVDRARERYYWRQVKEEREEFFAQKQKNREV